MNSTTTGRSTAWIIAVTAALLSLSLLLLAGAATSADAAPSGRPTATRNQTLAEARAATARFHDVRVAEDAGYVAVSPCIAEAGLGAMGIHYLNQDLLEDGLLDPSHPELLLYLPDAHGRLKLVGVEYLQIDADQDLSTDEDRPSLFGVPFDGPMEGHGPGEPVHYDLHVWVWSHNPAGMFAPFNAALSCATASHATHLHADH